MTSPVIECHGVSLEFGPSVILKDIHFEMVRGQCLVLVGPSGMGKTSLLKMVAGLIEPTSGTIKTEGSIGMLFQKNALFDSLTAIENILFPLREASSNTEEDGSKIAMDLLRAVELEHAKNLFPHELSGGMQKRLGIARALALKPEIILYDDPTAGLDPITSRMIAGLLKNLSRSEGVTTIVVTNDMMRAFQLADRIGFVWNQSLQIIGDVEEAKQSKKEPFHSFLRGLPLVGI